MKIDKSAEEIIDKNDIDKGPPHWVTKKSAIISCNEFADQEVTKYKAVIEKLLPLAQNHASSLRWDEEYSGDEVGGKEAQAIIDEAKQLIEK